MAPFAHLFKVLINSGLSTLCIATTLIISVNIHAKELRDFSTWEEKSFVAKNDFSFFVDEGIAAVKVYSNKSSSALFLKQAVNLNETPLLNWSWKISNVLNSVNERTKKGDDFAARVYVIASTGPFMWQTKTLSYVWSNKQQIGQKWPNPYTNKVIMMALDSGTSLQGSWQSHQRNIQQDLQNAFHDNFESIEAIAIMTDTDNTGQEATGWYKGFSFSAQ